MPGARNLRLAATLQPQPVLRRTEERDILNPSVARQGNSYYNFYSEFDGRSWHTALATSSDGDVWSKQGRVFSPNARSWEGSYIAANGSALLEDGEWWYWYQAGENGLPRIGLARSADGRTWRRESAPVIEPGPRGSWDERGVGDPYVLKRNGEFYIYYLGQNRARQQQIGVARSSDGRHWTKLRANPVLEIPWPGGGQPDVNGLGEPAVWEWDGWYWMIYTGRDEKESRALIMARSRDGVHWLRQQPALRGSEAWNREVICDPSVLVENGRMRLWFGGGDVARPDENLNGQIGVGELRTIAAPDGPK